MENGHQQASLYQLSQSGDEEATKCGYYIAGRTLSLHVDLIAMREFFSSLPRQILLFLTRHSLSILGAYGLHSLRQLLGGGFGIALRIAKIAG